ncbi:MAG: hypothetical protein JWN50_656 [Parcubacteria group bacterium]|nr:hypothetical protein [Parcubacteria group bacterium]
MFDEIVEQLTELLETMLKKDQIFKLGAQFSKKSYDALIEAGFTPEQAIQIVANQKSPVSAKS